MRHTLAERLTCFRVAWQGLRGMVAHEVNARFHAFATVAVIALGLAVRVDRNDWLWLVAAIALVWIAEALNTALELLADEINENERARLGHAKDLGAGAVLVAAVAAFVIGVLIFYPHLRRLVS